MENNQFYRRKIIEFDNEYDNHLEIVDWKFVKLNLNCISEIIPFDFKTKDKMSYSKLIIVKRLADEFLIFKNGKKKLLIEIKDKSNSFITFFKIEDFNLETIIMNNGNRYHALI
jgi:hypothetical protein